MVALRLTGSDSLIANFLDFRLSEGEILYSNTGLGVLSVDAGSCG